MPHAYVALKFLHVAAVVVFLGNLIVTALWKALADRTRDPAIVAFAQTAVMRSDRWCTGWGAALTLLTGVALAFIIDPRWWRIGWIAHGLGLFLVAAALWLIVLVPLQARQTRLAREWGTGPIPPAYWRLCRTWNVAGGLAVALQVVALYYMVAKPG